VAHRKSTATGHAREGATDSAIATESARSTDHPTEDATLAGFAAVAPLGRAWLDVAAVELATIERGLRALVGPPAIGRLSVSSSLTAYRLLEAAACVSMARELLRALE
jgi:hypothetical protein